MGGSSDDPTYHFNLGRLYYKKKEYNKAEQEYLKVLSIRKPKSYDYFHLAELYYAMNKHNEAYEAINKSLSSNPNFEKAKELYTQIVEKCPDKTAKALKKEN